MLKKDLIVFDLDGTLAPSKAPIDGEMNRLLTDLLSVKKVAVIGGGKYSLFKMQLLASLDVPKELLKNLFLFPTTSTAFYRYDHGWKNVYTLKLSIRERSEIREKFKEVLREINYVPPKKVYGPVLENRTTQMSFSPLGQDVVTRFGARGIKMKEEWKKKYNPVRLKIAKLLAKKLPNLEVRIGGITTIDVTRKGIDKAYGVRQIQKELHVPIKRMLFVGDALFPGGNDYAAKKTGVQCIAVRDPEDTKKVIKKILNLEHGT